MGVLRYGEINVPETQTLTLPVLPLTAGVVLPQMVVTVAVESPEAKAAAAAVGADGRLLLLPRVDGQYAGVGVIAKIESSGAVAAASNHRLHFIISCPPFW